MATYLYEVEIAYRHEQVARDMRRARAPQRPPRRGPRLVLRRRPRLAVPVPAVQRAGRV